MEDAEGRIYTGCNVENATYGLTICAERVAIFKAISEGARKFRRVAVVADTETLTPPCGACRQILWEFCGDVEIVLANLAREDRNAAAGDAVSAGVRCVVPVIPINKRGDCSSDVWREIDADSHRPADWRAFWRRSLRSTWRRSNPRRPTAWDAASSLIPAGEWGSTIAPFLYIIEQAFDEEKVVIPDAPAWTNDERYDIEARPPANSEAAKSNPFNIKLPPNEEQRLMLQTLFADRFQMKFHRETKEDNVYLLTAAKSLKLTESVNPKEYPWAGSVAGAVLAVTVSRA